MSNFLAVAAVTEILRQTLTPVVAQAVTGADVKTARPTNAGTGLPTKGVNLFLFRVTTNESLANADVVTRDSSGQLLRRPQIALNLQYLLSFYGDDEELIAHRLLGAAMRTLHARPMLTRALIRKTIDHVLATDSDHFLKNSDLADQLELVKFTPLSLSLEELSKLWSVFFQATYTLSVAYEASVVLIESEARPSPSLPVARRALHIRTLRPPFLDAIDPPMAPTGGSVVLRGRNLSHVAPRVLFGPFVVTPPASGVTDETIAVTVPAGPRAGVNTVRLRHELDFGTPNEPHGGPESNTAAFMLQPTITAVPRNVTTVTENGVQIKKGEIEVTFVPKVGRGQRAEVLLNERQPAAGSTAAAFTLAAPANNGLTNPADTETDTIRFPFRIPKAHEGDYLVRASVDGAQSELHIDGASGTYDAPVVTV
jgi:hypothetical protein